MPFEEGDARALPRSSAALGAVDQGASSGSPADAWWVRLTDGVDTALITPAGELQVAITAPVSLSGPVDQGASGSLADAWWFRLTDGVDTLAISAAGEASVAVTQPLPAGGNNIGSVNQGTTPWVVGDGGGSLTVDDGGGSLTVDGTVTANQGGAPWITRVTDGTDNLAISALGQAEVVLSSALPVGGNIIGQVVVLDGGGSITVDGTVSATQGTSPWVVSGSVTVASTTANQGNAGSIAQSWFTRLTDGTDVASVTAANQLEVAVTAALPTGANTIGAVNVNGTVPVSDGGGSLTVDGTVAVTQSTSPWVVSSAQLPAALVGGRLDENVGAWLGSTAPTVGQKAMASSLPVAIASDQTTLAVVPVDGATTANITAAGQSVTLSLPSGTSSTEFQITGVGVSGAVLVFESSIDGVVFNPRVYRGTGILNRLATSTTDVPSEWRGNSAGMVSVRVRCTALTAGTVTVTIRASEGPGAVFLNATIPIGGESVGNSSSANIAAASSFTGVYEDLTNVASIGITMLSNRATTVHLQYSQDATTLFSEIVYGVAASATFFVIIPPRAQYFRIVVDNLGPGAATLRLETLYRAIAAEQFRAPVGTSTLILDSLLVPITKSVLSGRTATDTYTDVFVTATGSVSAAPRETGTLANGAETAVAAAAVSILAANANRRSALIQNTGAANIRVGITGVTATTGIRLVPGGILELAMPYIVTNAIFAIREGAISSTAFAMETT